MDNAPTCEVVTRWPDAFSNSTVGIEFCGKVAVRRYPDNSGGWMYFCLEHGKPHATYAEPCYPTT